MLVSAFGFLAFQLKKTAEKQEQHILMQLFKRTELLM
jgi:hypothetical protein